MAVCPACHTEMTTGPGCDAGNPVVRILEAGGWREYERELWGGWSEPGEDRCPDCGTTPGHLHHESCDIERCPCCGGQMLGCECHLAHIQIRLEATEPDGRILTAWGSGDDDDEARADAERKLDALSGVQ